jgi:hypothetical protein
MELYATLIFRRAGRAGVAAFSAATESSGDTVIRLEKTAMAETNSLNFMCEVFLMVFSSS